MADATMPIATLFQGAEYQATWQFTDADGNSLLSGGDTLAITFRAAQGGTAHLTVTAAAPPATGYSNVDTATGEVDVLITDTSIGTLCTALGLAAQELGRASVGVTRTRGGIETVIGRVVFTIEPEA
jgi:hypothetical protein